MCIAVVIPKGVRITDAAIRRCSTWNHDGAGIAYVSRGAHRQRLVSLRHYVPAHSGDVTYVEDMIEEYGRLIADGAAEHAMLMHFRMATCGGVSKSNTHPFPVKKGAFVHNGHMFSRPGSDSDTALFARRYGTSLKKHFVRMYTKELSQAVGDYNKFAFLWSDGTYDILNRDRWTSDQNGVLFSTTPSSLLASSELITG